jgi:hypothetical protein
VRNAGVGVEASEAFLGGMMKDTRGCLGNDVGAFLRRVDF